MGGVLLVGRFMPDHPSKLAFAQISEIVAAGRSFDGKSVELLCLAVPAPEAPDDSGGRMFLLRSIDPEQELAIRARIPERLLAELGDDAPSAVKAERKYIVVGRLSGDRNGLTLEAESIGRRSKLKKN